MAPPPPDSNPVPQDAAEREALRLEAEAANDTPGAENIDQGGYVYFERGFGEAVVFERERVGRAVDVDETVVVRGELSDEGADLGHGVFVWGHVEESGEAV